MRVDIQHREDTKGWLSKTTFYVVDLTVTLSEEELQIVKQSQLESDIVLERGVPADRKKSQFEGIEDVWHLTIYRFTKGETDSYAFATPLEAKQYEAEIREIMPKVKEHIMGNAAVENKSDSFEL